MPKSKSKLKLSQRRQQAYELFAKGYTNVDVAKDLEINKDTAAKYREKYEASIQSQAAANPGFLRDVLTNTVRSLKELDQIRADAWKQLKPRRMKIEHHCPECEHEWTTTLRFDVSDQSRVQYQNVLLKAQDQRSKLFGVMGVKQEVFIAIMQVKVVQDRILTFLTDNLCAADRAELEAFLQGPEMAQYMAASGELDAAQGIMELESEEVEVA